MPGVSRSSLLNVYANVVITARLTTVRLLYFVYGLTESAHEGSPVFLALTPQRSNGKPRDLHAKLALGLLYTLLKCMQL